jgi:hypothetical protein
MRMNETESDAKAAIEEAAEYLRSEIVGKAGKRGRENVRKSNKQKLAPG